MIKKTFKKIKESFSKLKTIDFILIFVALSSVVVFLIFFFRKSSYIRVTVSVAEDSVLYNSGIENIGPKLWLANSFHKGLVEKDGLGNIQAEVVDVYSYEKAPSHENVYLDLKLRVIYNKATNSYTYKGTAVSIGSIIKLNFNSVYAEGMVVDMENLGNKPKQKTIQVEAQIREESPVFPGTVGTKPYLADAIKVGDSVNDNKGNILIKVISKRVSPAIITVTTSDGRVIETFDPVKKDVYLTLLVSAEEINGNYYLLGDIPVMIDMNIPFKTSSYMIYPVVTKFDYISD
jgi:hypothetical protein